MLIADSKAATAVESAQRVIDVLENRTFQRHLTTDIFNIAQNGHLLPEVEKQKLISLGFDFSGEKITMKTAMMQNYYDTEHFRIHYDISGYNAVDTTGSDGDSVPIYIETMGEVFEEVYNHEINKLGYTPPPNDNGDGGSNAFDIYVQRMNAYGFTIYGNLVGDNENSPITKENNAYTSHMKMNSNYEGFPNTELENIQVTAAHEFFHAIQLGYDGEEEIWLLEATAVWMEEENYDDVNDCYQYMIPWFEQPHISITQNFGYDLHAYGSFILFKYIDEHLGGNEIIRKTWENSRIYNGYQDGEDYSILEIDLALKEKGYSFKEALNNMVIANSILSSDANAGIYAYEEAQGYKDYREESYYDTVAIELGILDTINFYQDAILKVESLKQLQPYASQYVKVNTDVPVRIALKESDTDRIPIDDLSLIAIIKDANGGYTIDEDKLINIDPGSNSEWIYVAVVSHGNQRSVYSYEIVATNGISENIRQFTISKNYPNPFNNTINIKLKVISPQRIDINIYDILGRKIKSIYSDQLTGGTHEFQWDGTSNIGHKVSSGVYYITAKGNNYQEWKKVTLVK